MVAGGAMDSAGAAVARSVAADVAGAVGSDVDGAQQDLACPLGLLPWRDFLFLWRHWWFPHCCCQVVPPLLLLVVPGPPAFL